MTIYGSSVPLIKGKFDHTVPQKAGKIEKGLPPPASIKKGAVTPVKGGLKTAAPASQMPKSGTVASMVAASAAKKPASPPVARKVIAISPEAHKEEMPQSGTVASMVAASAVKKPASPPVAPKEEMPQSGTVASMVAASGTKKGDVPAVARKVTAAEPAPKNTPPKPGFFAKVKEYFARKPQAHADVPKAKVFSLPKISLSMPKFEFVSNIVSSVKQGYQGICDRLQKSRNEWVKQHMLPFETYTSVLERIMEPDEAAVIKALQAKENYSTKDVSDLEKVLDAYEDEDILANRKAALDQLDQMWPDKSADELLLTTTGQKQIEANLPVYKREGAWQNLEALYDQYHQNTVAYTVEKHFYGDKIKEGGESKSILNLLADKGIIQASDEALLTKFKEKKPLTEGEIKRLKTIQETVLAPLAYAAAVPANEALVKGLSPKEKALCQMVADKPIEMSAYHVKKVKGLSEKYTEDFLKKKMAALDSYHAAYPSRPLDDSVHGYAEGALGRFALSAYQKMMPEKVAAMKAEKAKEASDDGVLSEIATRFNALKDLKGGFFTYLTREGTLSEAQAALIHKFLDKKNLDQQEKAELLKLDLQIRSVCSGIDIGLRASFNDVKDWKGGFFTYLAGKGVLTKAQAALVQKFLDSSQTINEKERVELLQLNEEKIQPIALVVQDQSDDSGYEAVEKMGLKTKDILSLQKEYRTAHESSSAPVLPPPPADIIMPPPPPLDVVLPPPPLQQDAPPPPPPPAMTTPPKARFGAPAAAASPARADLLADIQKRKELKRVTTDDKSQPMVKHQPPKQAGDDVMGSLMANLQKRRNNMQLDDDTEGMNLFI